jgi:hypothetical protein
MQNIRIHLQHSVFCWNRLNARPGFRAWRRPRSGAFLRP